VFFGVIEEFLKKEGILKFTLIIRVMIRAEILHITKFSPLPSFLPSLPPILPSFLHPTNLY
jgi:hypothetical protein